LSYNCPNCTSNNERYNLLKFLRKCKKGNYFQSLNINQEFIIDEINKIQEYNDVISHIKLQRDKLFAHEDAFNSTIVNDITLDETKNLIDLCQNIIFEIYGEIFDTHYEFEVANSAEWNLKNILKNLNERNIQSIEERKDIRKLLDRKK